MKPRLTCKGLSKAFNGLMAVSDVTFSLAGPGVVGLIGPNGAGKTTLLDVLTGFTRPDTGQWGIHGIDVSGAAPATIVERGLVRSFQHPRLVAGLSALGNVLLAAPIARTQSFLGAFWSRPETRLLEEQLIADAKRRLGWAGLGTQVTTAASALSYGQQKLVALCCCLATRARIVLLDEPVAGVHPAMVSEICARIRELAADNYLILMVEHNLDAVRAVAGRLLVMDHGRLIADGPVEDVLSRKEVQDAYLH